MQNLTNDQKANLYNQYLFRYERIQEQIRQIKAENFELSPANEQKVKILEMEARKIFNETSRLYK
jgi:hypothetical protein